MSNRNDPSPAGWDVPGFASTLASWIGDFTDLLHGLVALRGMDGAGANAVAVVLAIPEVRKLRLGWELWEAMVEGSGRDPEILLIERMPLGDLETARHALWGEVWPETLDS